MPNVYLGSAPTLSWRISNFYCSTSKILIQQVNWQTHKNVQFCCIWKFSFAVFIITLATLVCPGFQSSLSPQLLHFALHFSFWLALCFVLLYFFVCPLVCLLFAIIVFVVQIIVLSLFVLLFGVYCFHCTEGLIQCLAFVVCHNDDADAVTDLTFVLHR